MAIMAMMREDKFSPLPLLNSALPKRNTLFIQRLCLNPVRLARGMRNPSLHHTFTQVGARDLTFIQYYKLPPTGTHHEGELRQYL